METFEKFAHKMGYEISRHYMEPSPISNGSTMLPALALSFSPEPEKLSEVRRLIEQAACQTPLHRDRIEDLLSAFDEGIGNAIRHGCTIRNCRLYVMCQSLPDSLIVTIQDEGTGFMVPDAFQMPDPFAERGRGLPLMRILTDEVRVHSGPTGTTVILTMHF